MLMAPFIGSCNFNITIIVFQSNAVQQSVKANQGWPKKGKGCPCLNPGNCLRVMFSILSGYHLSQSTMVSHAFLPYPSRICKYKRCEQAMLNIQHSSRVWLLLVIFMDAMDLLWLLVPVRLVISVHELLRFTAGRIWFIRELKQTRRRRKRERHLKM